MIYLLTPTDSSKDFKNGNCFLLSDLVGDPQLFNWLTSKRVQLPRAPPVAPPKYEWIPLFFAFKHSYTLSYTCNLANQSAYNNIWKVFIKTFILRAFGSVMGRFTRWSITCWLNLIIRPSVPFCAELWKSKLSILTL